MEKTSSNETGRDGGRVLRGVIVAWLTLGVLFVIGSCISYAPEIERAAGNSVVVVFGLFVILSLMLPVLMLRRRTRHSAAVGCLVVPVVFVVFVFAGTITCFAPKATKLAPDEEWTRARILSSVPIARTNLVFIGGVSGREPTWYFVVNGELPELADFRRETEFREQYIKSLRYGADHFDIPFEVSDDCEVFTKYEETTDGIGTLIVVKDAAGATVVYHSM